MLFCEAPCKCFRDLSKGCGGGELFTEDCAVWEQFSDLASSALSPPTDDTATSCCWDPPTLRSPLTVRRVLWGDYVLAIPSGGSAGCSHPTPGFYLRLDEQIHRLTGK